MISIAKFETELNEIEKLFKKLKYLEERISIPNTDFDPAEYRKTTYIQNWKKILSNNIYNFLLCDNSILKFKLAPKKASYLFYECPYNCLSYNDFLAEHGLKEDDEGYKTFYNEYEIYLDQCQTKTNPITIRYDLDFDSYNHGLHPVSHLHIGNHNQIRIGINKIMHPKTFTNFILRQHYTPLWNSILSEENPWRENFLKDKARLIKIDKEFWGVFDESEFYLS